MGNKIIFWLKQIITESREKIEMAILAGFGLVIALRWNSVIQSLIERFIPQTGMWIGELVTAIIVTFVLTALVIVIKKVL